ncbi:DUF6684 family protein [Halomicrococcus sp. NG-SE-24]|uniref:DUF6684 family protein n=1 Tax=Halomicrococcus sp. NG-SE-24 TaxID=3436928 RepID=UPI003D957379
MAESVFDKETLLDITVNVVPLGIMAFFFVLFLLQSLKTGDRLVELVSWGLIIVPFTLLALLTYIAAREI